MGADKLTRAEDSKCTSQAGDASQKMSADCSWRPDPSLSTPLARQWQAAYEQRKDLPMPPGCTYTVQFGDDLNAVAARELRREGAAVNSQSVRAEVTALVQANDGQYRSLDCNKDLIKVGWKLHIPGEKCNDQPPVKPPCPEQPPEQPPCPPQPWQPPTWWRPGAPPTDTCCRPPVQYCPPPPVDYCPPPQQYQPPRIVCYPYDMQVINVPEPCQPVQIPENCCCCCNRQRPMYNYAPGYNYQPQPPQSYYYQAPPQNYDMQPPSWSYQRPPEPGYAPRPYANYPQQPLIPSNDWVHRGY